MLRAAYRVVSCGVLFVVRSIVHHVSCVHVPAWFYVVVGSLSV